MVMRHFHKSVLFFALFIAHPLTLHALDFCDNGPEEQELSGCRAPSPYIYEEGGIFPRFEKASACAMEAQNQTIFLAQGKLGSSTLTAMAGKYGWQMGRNKSHKSCIKQPSPSGLVLTAQDKATDVVLFTREPLDKFRSATQELLKRLHHWQGHILQHPGTDLGVPCSSQMFMCQMFTEAELFTRIADLLRLFLRFALYNPDWDPHFKRQYSPAYVALSDGSAGVRGRLFDIAHMNDAYKCYGVDPLRARSHDKMREVYRLAFFGSPGKNSSDVQRCSTDEAINVAIAKASKEKEAKRLRDWQFLRSNPHKGATRRRLADGEGVPRKPWTEKRSFNLARPRKPKHRKTEPNQSRENQILENGANAIFMKEQITWSHRKSVLLMFFKPSELDPDLLRLHESSKDQDPGPTDVKAFSKLVSANLEHKLGPLFDSCHTQLAHAQWNDEIRHRPLTEDEELALCCAYWDDYCLGYTMPASCSRLGSQQSVCKAACTSFGIPNSPSSRAGYNKENGVKLPFCWEVQDGG
jgi:hypothetical protein